MALEFWFPEQIANVLSALAKSGSMMQALTAERTEEAQAFYAGYQTALSAVADAFGVLPPLPPACCKEPGIRYLSTAHADARQPQASTILS
jgi:hypothetical protein